MKNIYFVIILSLLFIWWIFLRAFDLWWASFWIDEWYSSITSYYALLNSFAPILETGSYTFSRYFFTFFQSLSFSVFWISDLTARMPSFVFGIFIMLVSALFAYDLLEKHKYRLVWTIWISFLSIFSTWQILWSREARFYELLALLLLLGIYFLYKFDSKNKPLYFWAFSLIAWIWSIYHPFLFSLFAVWWVYLIYYFVVKYIEYKDIKKSVVDSYKYGVFILLWYVLYFLVNMLFRYISTWWVEVSSWVPSTYDLPNHYRESYVNFYSDLFSRELGVIYLAFILGLFYLGYIKKYAYLIIFGWIFLINFYIITQKWMMVHSRYMYHLFSIITIIWWYVVFLLLSYIYDKWINFKNIALKWVSFVWMWIIIFLVLSTFSITFLPKTTYYVDHTTPKPDFKSAYEFVRVNHQDTKIISWMPQLCVWYNLDNKNICEYATRVNLTWRQSNNKRLIEQEYHNYTATAYIDDISQIQNHIFILEDLSLRMSINRDIVDYVLNSCDKIFEDNWDWNRYNYIWVWKCGE